MMLLKRKWLRGIDAVLRRCSIWRDTSIIKGAIKANSRSWDQFGVISVSANQTMISLNHVLCLFQELESKAQALQDKHEDLKREVEKRQLEVRYLMQR